MNKIELLTDETMMLNGISPSHTKHMAILWEVIDSGDTNALIAEDGITLHAGNKVGFAKIKASAKSKIIGAQNYEKIFSVDIRKNDNITPSKIDEKQGINKLGILVKAISKILVILLTAISAAIFAVFIVHDRPEIEVVRAYIPLAAFNEGITGIDGHPVSPRSLNRSLDIEIRNMDNEIDALVGVIFIRVLGGARVNNFTLSMTEHYAFNGEILHTIEWTTTVRNDSFLMLPMFITYEFDYGTDVLALRVDDIWGARRRYPQYQPNYITYDIVAFNRPVLSWFMNRTSNLPPIQQAPAQRRVTTRANPDAPNQNLPSYVWILSQ